MSEEATFSANVAVGHLQRKSRFYGWSKGLYLLDKRGLARLASDQQPQPASQKDPENGPQPTTLVIGSIGNVNPSTVSTFKRKQLIKPAQILDVSVKGQREVVLRLKSETLVLRAQTPGDCNLWLEALYFFLSCSADASAEPAAGDVQAPASSRHSSEITDGMSQCRPSTASTMGATAATSFILPSTEIPSLPLDITGSLNASTSISRIVMDTHARANAIDRVNTQDEAMGWLPSTCNLPEALESHANAPATSAQQHAAGGNVPENEALCLQTYVPAASPEAKPENPSAAERPILGSSGAKVDVGSFDADMFFDEESAHARSGENLPCSRSLSAKEPSCAAQAANDLTSGFIGSVAPAATSALDAGILNDYSGSCGFNDLFNILQDPGSTDPTHANHAVVRQTHGIGMADADASNVDENVHSGQDNDESDVPLGLMFEKHGCSQGHALENNGRACSNDKAASPGAASTLVPTATINPAPAGINDSMVILDTSIADFASALIDTSGLGNWDLGLGNSQLCTGLDEPASSASITTATMTAALVSNIPKLASTEPSEGCNGRQPEQQQSNKLPAVLLNSPDHHRLGRRNPDLDRSAVTVGGLDTRHHHGRSGAQPDNLGKPVGIQSGLLAKYSSSLHASRALLATAGRGGRHLGTSNGHASDVHASGGESAAFNANAAPVVQYESVKTANTGVSKVIRGQLTKDIIEKDIANKPELSVCRMRRIKSESKVVPLKAIRLKLNGSIASNNDLVSRSGVGSTGGLRHGSNVSHLDDMPLSKLASEPCKSGTNRVEIASANPGDAGMVSGKGDPFGEFSEIQERLRRAEEQKRFEQRARIHDKEGVDNVRIADIIENRQDIPLAVQIEEKRRMQLAKQQALLSQQLEQQRIQIETQRANVELQRQYEQFKRQSLHPSLYDGSDGYPGQWMQHQDAYAGLSPTISQFQQPLHGNRPVSSQGHYSPYTTNYDQAASAGTVMQPMTPVTIGNPGAAWSNAHYQQQQQRPRTLASGRPSSLYANNPQMQSYQRPDPLSQAQAPVRTQTIGSRRQAGAAFVKHNRSISVAARSVHSNGSSDSWQSHVDHKSAGASIHAKTDPAYNGSIYIPSPEIPTMTAKRSLSYGNAEHFRGASIRSGGFAGRAGRASDASSAIPPVPPLPQAAYGFQQHHNQHYQHHYQHYQPAHPYAANQGPPVYPHSGYSAWGSPPGGHGGSMGRHNSYLSMQKSGHSGAMYSRYAHEEPMSTEMHKISRKRTEMSANMPSLLQRLDQARETGILPGRHVEKLPYSQGAYQNHNANQIVREGVNPQYFGDGDTLLIDRVYESEKTRSALLRKISRTYTGIGGETAPPAMFTH